MREKFRIETSATPRPDASLGAGTFGTVAEADVVVRLLRKADHSDSDADYVVARERTPRGLFVTKTYHCENPESHAASSVRNYERLKQAGVSHIPSTYRLSDADEKVVIAQMLSDDSRWLLTSNSAPDDDSMRPISFDPQSFNRMLNELGGELEKMSEQGIQIEDRDMIFFDLPRVGIERSNVDFVFGDFDAITLGLDEEETLTSNVIEMTKALFGLVFSQRVNKQDGPSQDDLRSWASTITAIQLWASKYRVDSRSVYADWLGELKSRQEADRLRRA